MRNENPFETFVRRLTDAIGPIQAAMPSSPSELDQRVRDAVRSLSERFHLVPKDTFDKKIEDLDDLKNKVTALEERIQDLENKD
jgi:BMFP domain-containing protein YqiC